LNSTLTFPGTVFRIIGGSFEDNIGTGSGGAIATTLGAAELVITPSQNGATQFIGNRALAQDGGAISNFLDTTIRDAVFSENSARNGAGIFVGVPSVSVADIFDTNGLTLSGAQITDNDARIRGGGVFIESGASFVNGSSFIDSNSSTIGGDIFEA